MVLTRYEWGLAGDSAVACRSGMFWPSAVARLFSFCRQVESSRVRAQERAPCVLLERGLKGRRFRDAGALPRGVRRRPEAVVTSSGVPRGRPAPSSSFRPLRARRCWRRCTGPRRPSAQPSPTVGGVGASPSPRTTSPSGSTSSWRCSTGEEVKLRVRRCAPMPRTRPRARAAAQPTRRTAPARVRAL